MVLKNTNIFFRYFLALFLFKNFKKFRMWDYIASKRNDFIIAASSQTKSRIEKYYKNNVDLVLYPPVEIEKFKNLDYKTKDYYITISMLTESKRLDVLIKKFNKMPEKKLKII
jgi:glycosyltransferase involved in cell wall biosynthesis